MKAVKNGNGEGARLLTKVPHNRYLTPAWLLSVLVALSFVLVSGTLAGSVAKYNAQDTRGASARVAKWDPFQNIDEDDRAEDALDHYDPVLLVFPDSAAVTTTLTLANGSEVAARYLLTPSVQGFAGTQPQKDAFLAAIVSSLEANADYVPGEGVVVAPDAGAQLLVSIPSATFERLSFEAVARQVD